MQLRMVQAGPDFAMRILGNAGATGGVSAFGGRSGPTAGEQIRQKQERQRGVDEGAVLFRRTRKEAVRSTLEDGCCEIDFKAMADKIKGRAG